MRLKSMSGGHGALQMVISQLGEVRSSLKALTQAQATASEDTMRWAAAHENRAIAETFSHLAELSLVWTDVQRDFAGLSFFRGGDVLLVYKIYKNHYLIILINIVMIFFSLFSD